MHEMALAEGVLQLIEDAAQREIFARVTTIWLEIGQLSSVEPEALAVDGGIGIVLGENVLFDLHHACLADARCVGMGRAVAIV